MQRERLNEWIAAMESGEYDPGYGALIDRRGGFCACGVGCVIAFGYPRKQGLAVDFKNTTQAAFPSVVPLEFMEYYDLPYDVVEKIASVHDVSHAGFQPAIDYIKQYMETGA